MSDISAMVTPQVFALPRLGRWLEDPIMGEGFAIVARGSDGSEVRIQRTTGHVVLATSRPPMVQLLASSMSHLVVMAVKYSAARAQLTAGVGRKNARLADSFLTEIQHVDTEALAPPNTYWRALASEIRRGI